MDIFFEQSAMGKEHEVEFDLDSRIVCLDVSICTCCIYFGSNWREVRQAVFERDGKPYLTKSSVSTIQLKSLTDKSRQIQVS